MTNDIDSSLEPPAPKPPTVVHDHWIGLRSLTPSRIALGRAGHAVPTRELLRADAAHARARAAVHAPLEVASLRAELEAVPGLATPLEVRSAASTRDHYLLRPDLGRRLSAESRQQLRDVSSAPAACDLLLVIGDGLSTSAVQRHAVAVVTAITAARPANWSLGPPVIATEARVALGDEIGKLLRGQLVAMLIGERPGLSCQESLGIYLTWQPQPGRTDAERNCLSNIHPGGLSPSDAASRLWWLATEARRLATTGVALKDRSSSFALANASTERITPPTAL